MNLNVTFLLFILFNLTAAKPLCDSLEDYFRKSKQPGAKRLKKTVTRICTAFQLFQYDVDPIEIMLPQPEDDDDVGAREDDDRVDDVNPDYDFAADELLLSDANFRFPNPLSRWPIPQRRFHPAPFQRPQRPLWRVSERREHKGKPGETIKNQETKNLSTKTTPARQNETTASTEVETPRPLPAPVTATLPSEENTTSGKPPPLPPIDDHEYVDDEEEEEDDERDDSIDPVLNDLADFVASVRFLSLNDTTHLKVIFPSTNVASDKSDAVIQPSLAIEAPVDLLPSGYRSAFPSKEDGSTLPQVYRIVSRFSCEQQTYSPGVYADINTDCQVFHLCLPPGHGFKSATFLCPRNLKYSQKLLRCDWAKAVNCSQSSHYFSKNKYFGPNYNTYLQSLRTLMHGDALESNEEVDDTPVTTSATTTAKAVLKKEPNDNADNLGNNVNSALLGKLRSIIALN